MQSECLRAAKYLEQVGVSAEVIDPIWLQPLDLDTITTSVSKTKRLCVVDNGWTTCGAGSEIVSSVSERLSRVTQIHSLRLGFAPTTCPPTPALEDIYYPNAQTIASDAYDLVTGRLNNWKPELIEDLKEIEFKGPF